MSPLHHPALPSSFFVEGVVNSASQFMPKNPEDTSKYAIEKGTEYVHPKDTIASRQQELAQAGIGLERRESRGLESRGTHSGFPCRSAYMGKCGFKCEADDFYDNGGPCYPIQDLSCMSNLQRKVWARVCEAEFPPAPWKTKHIYPSKDDGPPVHTDLPERENPSILDYYENHWPTALAVGLAFGIGTFISSSRSEKIHPPTESDASSGSVSEETSLGCVSEYNDSRRKD